MTLTKNNFKSPHIFVPYLSFFLLGIGLLINYYLNHKIDNLYTAVLIFFFLGVLFLIGFMTKISIEKKGITQSSLSKDFLLNWNNIKTIGVYRLNRFGVKIIEPKDYDKFSFLGQKFIFISTKHNFIPKHNLKLTSEFIHFHWRKEAWEEINKYFEIE